MTWNEFVERVRPYFGGLHGNIQLRYRISGDGRRTMTVLECEYDWEQAICRMREKIRVARTRLASMEIENMVSTDGSHDNKNVLTFWILADAGTPGTPAYHWEGGSA
jgi:hypothetical protein